MAPKADKMREAAAAKKIEDKTFGMKNKNKVRCRRCVRAGALLRPLTRVVGLENRVHESAEQLPPP